MDDDKDLFEQLARGPLNRNGFNDALRKKINDRIEKPRRGSTGSVSRIAAGAAITSLLLVLCGLWLWKGIPSHNNSESLTASSASQFSLEGKFAPKEPQSAILIGLRKDAAQGGVSTYRTVLVVPTDKKLAVAADGPGLWMPYKQKFWKIEPATDSMGTETQTLVASPLDSEEQSPLKLPSALRRTEKLLYAGNRYVSILQTTTVSAEGDKVNHSSVWVKEIEQLKASARQRDVSSPAEPHLTLSAVVGSDKAPAGVDQWTIARAPGKWVAKQPSAASNAGNGNSVADWEDIAVPLSSDVLSHDTLSLAWDDIYGIERSARDAFTSPTEDLIAIVTDRSINIYAYRVPDFKKRAVKLPVDPAESIVMVQWATSSYVEVWKEQLGERIPPTNDGL